MRRIPRFVTPGALRFAVYSNPSPTLPVNPWGLRTALSEQFPYADGNLHTVSGGLWALGAPSDVWVVSGGVAKMATAPGGTFTGNAAHVPAVKLDLTKDFDLQFDLTPLIFPFTGANFGITSSDEGFPVISWSSGGGLTAGHWIASAGHTDFTINGTATTKHRWLYSKRTAGMKIFMDGSQVASYTSTGFLDTNHAITINASASLGNGSGSPLALDNLIVRGSIGH